MPGRKVKPGYMLGGKDDKAKKGKRKNKILQEATVKIGDKIYKVPDSVKKSKVAKFKWFEIMNLYKESDVAITTNADIGLLERYCLTYAEYQQLIDVKRLATERSSDAIAAIGLIHELRVDTKINQKNTILLKMDTELFLTPLSKCRAIPRKTAKDSKKEEMKKQGFNL